MKVDVPGLIAAAQKLLGLATSAQGLLAEMAPLAADPHRAVPRHASTWPPCSCGERRVRRPYSLHKAAGHLVMVAAEVRWPGGDQRRRPRMCCCRRRRSSTTPRWPHSNPFRRSRPTCGYPVPPGTPLSGEGFSQLVHTGSADERDRFQHHRDEQRHRHRHRGDHGARGGRDWCRNCGKVPSAPPRSRAGSTNTSPRSTRSPTAGSSSPARRAARRRLQPDGRRDAQAAGVPRTSDRDVGPGAAAGDTIAASQAFQARPARTARSRRGGTLRRGDRNQHIAQRARCTPQAPAGAHPEVAVPRAQAQRRLARPLCASRPARQGG